MKTYEGLTAALLDEPQDHQLFQNVSEHLLELLGDSWHPLQNIERLPGVPEAAKNVWYLWYFAAEVCGNGMSAWLANTAPPAPVIIASHGALKAVGAADALELFEAGVVPAREWDAPFLGEPEATWFEKFPSNPKLPTFDEIDLTSYEVCAEPLSAIVAAYIRKNRAMLQGHAV